VHYNRKALASQLLTVALLYTMMAVLWGGLGLLAVALVAWAGQSLWFAPIYLILAVLWAGLAIWGWISHGQARRMSVAMRIDRAGMTLCRPGNRDLQIPWTGTRIWWTGPATKPILRFGGITRALGFRSVTNLPAEVHQAIAHFRG